MFLLFQLWKSISDGLSLSIFCPNMQKVRPIIEKMDGKVFILRLRRLFFHCNFQSTFLYPVSWLGAKDFFPVKEKL